MLCIEYSYYYGFSKAGLKLYYLKANSQVGQKTQIWNPKAYTHIYPRVKDYF